MGGFGSGSWQSWDAKETVERQPVLDIRRLHRDARLQPGKQFPMYEFLLDRTRNSVHATVSEESLTLSFRWHVYGALWDDVVEVIPIEWTPCHYGGRRPWFLCPGREGEPCGRRVAVLYGGREPFFLCRECYGLVYESQRTNHAWRLLMKARKIRMRLGGLLSTWRDPFPEKPKRMRWETYHRLAAEALAAEREGLKLIHAEMARFDRRRPPQPAGSNRPTARRKRKRRGRWQGCYPHYP